MRRTYWAIAVAVPVLLLAGDVVYWRIAAQQLRSGYEAWLAARRTEGWQSDSGAVSVSGWPRAATILIPNMVLRHDDSSNPGANPGMFAVTASAVTLSVSLFRPDSLTISIVGPTRLQLSGSVDLVLNSDENWLSVPLRQAPPYAIDLHATSLRIASAAETWKATAGLLDVRAALNAVPAATDPASLQRASPKEGSASDSGGAHNEQSGPDDAPAAAQGDEPRTKTTGTSPAEPSVPPVVFSLSAEAIALPAVRKWPLGPNISSVSLDGQINGRLPATRNLTARNLTARNITDWAEAWRDGDGSMDITHLALGWGPLGVTGSATLALDEQLQPMGSGNGRFVGYGAALDRLAASGTLTRSAATAAKAVLSLMAGSGEANEPSVVDVPLTLQYRTLSMRQVPMLRLPELDWPAR